jgi:hypothetical protein
MEYNRNSYRLLEGKCFGNRSLRRPRKVLENNFKTDFGYEVMKILNSSVWKSVSIFCARDFET